ncbi:MAG: hypothetical protein RL348_186 [Bacteroidota bacterium]|jgi:hypothetical protein
MAMSVDIECVDSYFLLAVLEVDIMGLYYVDCSLKSPEYQGFHYFLINSFIHWSISSIICLST